jgi:hypothetical protein
VRPAGVRVESWLRWSAAVSGRTFSDLACGREDVGDDRAEADRRAAAVPAGGRFEADLLYERGGDGRPGVGFVAPLASARVPAGLFDALAPGAGAAVDYVAGRDASKPAAAGGSYRVLEDGGMDLAGPRKAGPPVHLRRILVYSSANATGQARACALKLARAAGELSRLVRTAGTRFHPTPDAVAARVTAVAAQRRVKAYLRTTITQGPAGKTGTVLALRPGRDRRRGRGRRLVRPDGQPGAGQASPAEVLRRYKGQLAVERRYGEFKGPLAAAPLFLKTNRRITALITVICLALLIFCLAGRQVRNALAPRGEMMTGLPGFYTPPPPDPPAEPSSRPLPTCA